MAAVRNIFLCLVLIGWPMAFGHAECRIFQASDRDAPREVKDVLNRSKDASVEVCENIAQPERTKIYFSTAPGRGQQGVCF